MVISYPCYVHEQLVLFCLLKFISIVTLVFMVLRQTVLTKWIFEIIFGDGKLSMSIYHRYYFNLMLMYLHPNIWGTSSLLKTLLMVMTLVDY